MGERTLEQTIEFNVDRLLKDGQDGKGELGEFFIQTNAKLVESIKNQHTLAMQRNPGLAPLTPEQINEKANAELKTVATNLKTPLMKAAAGDTGATDQVNITQMTSLATSMSSAHSAMQSGNVLHLLGSLGGLLNFPAIGDFITSGFKYLFANEKKQSFGDILKETKLARGMDAAAKNLPGTSGEKLKAALLTDPDSIPAPAATPAATLPVADPVAEAAKKEAEAIKEAAAKKEAEAKQKETGGEKKPEADAPVRAEPVKVAHDPRFDGPNGVVPQGGPKPVAATQPPAKEAGLTPQ